MTAAQVLTLWDLAASFYFVCRPLTRAERRTHRKKKRAIRRWIDGCAGFVSCVDVGKLAVIGGEDDDIAALLRVRAVV